MSNNEQDVDQNLDANNLDDSFNNDENRDVNDFVHNVPIKPFIHVERKPSHIVTPTEDPDSRLTLRDRAKYFFAAHWKGVVCVIVPLAGLPLLSFPPKGYELCGYTLFVMAIYWVTECIPLPVTSLLPIIIFPFTQVMSTFEVVCCYMNDTIIIFLGALFLAYSVEQSGLHRRLALNAIKLIGYSHMKLLLAMGFTTMFVSMFITNTAATTMMVPINFALLKVFEDEKMLTIYESQQGTLVASDLTTCYFCMATYSATIGGIGTLVGTVTNLVMRGLLADMYPEAPDIFSFPMFSAFTVVLMIVLEIGIYFIMCIQYFGWLRPKSKAYKSCKITLEAKNAAKKSVEDQLKKIGSITFWEFIVINLFLLAIFLFFLCSPQMFPGWGDRIMADFDKKKFIKDSATAMMVCYALFLAPSTYYFFHHFTKKYVDEVPDKPIPPALNFEVLNKIMPFSFMFLLGGGFALSTAAQPRYTNLNGQIGDALAGLSVLPPILILFIIIVSTVFITNFASNVAVCNVIAPIAMELGRHVGSNPAWFDLAAGLSSSFCFCLPVGTPGNLVVQVSAKVPTGKMIKAGFFPTLYTIFFTWLLIAYFAPVVYQGISEPPSWAAKEKL